MKLAITMTTDCRIIVSEDVFSLNEGIVLPRLSDPLIGLAALTCVVKARSNRRRGRVDCLGLATRRVVEALPGYRLWLLASHAAWQPDTPRMRVLKLWRSLENGGMKMPVEARGTEIARADSRGIRWFALGEVGAGKLPTAHDIVSAEQTSFLVAAPMPPALEEYLEGGWADGHPATMEFWRDMGLVASRKRNLLFRPFGDFDDAEVGVNVIGAPETIALLAAPDANL